MATGLKMARPDLKIITIQGDGDAAAIGGTTSSMWPAATSGSPRSSTTTSPTADRGAVRADSEPRLLFDHLALGLEEPPFDLCKLMTAAGANFVARARRTGLFSWQISWKGLAHKGFSFVEVITMCPPITAGGIRHGNDRPAMLRWQKENSVPIEKAAKMSEEELKGKIVTGFRRPRQTDKRQYDAVRQRLKKEAGHETRS